MTMIRIPPATLVRRHPKPDEQPAAAEGPTTLQVDLTTDAELRGDGRYHFTWTGEHYSVSQDAVVEPL